MFSPSMTRLPWMLVQDAIDACIRSHSWSDEIQISGQTEPPVTSRRVIAASWPRVRFSSRSTVAFYDGARATAGKRERMSHPLRWH